MLTTARIIPKLLLVFLIIGLFGCYPTLKKKAQRPKDALKQVRFFYPTFSDDMHSDSLILAIERNLEYLNRLDPEKIFRYGSHSFTCQQVRESQEIFRKLLLKNQDPSQLNKMLKRHFQLYRAAGRVGNNKILFTGYFEPVYDGSLTADGVFKYPIYKKPDDLIRINLSPFSSKFKGESIFARIEDKKILPYYSRYNIEADKALRGRNLEIAWLKNPVDVAFLHIQGSGRLRLPDGNSILVGYQAKNGRPYRSIGRYMIDKGFLKKEKISMQSIRSYLSEHPEIVEDVLNHNPSYVFFRMLGDNPLGNIGVPLTPGRSLALDRDLFPKGALSFISCKKPVVNDQGVITKWIKFSRFVLNQDTGGAIRGAGRADLFWGSGAYAEVAAGHMQHDGELYILIKKPQAGDSL